MILDNASVKRGVTLQVTAIGLVAVLLIGAVAANEQWQGKRSQDTARAALASELGTVAQALIVALDSTDQQLAFTKRVIGWLELREDASSAELIGNLSRLRATHRAPAALTAVAELAAAGQLDLIPDPHQRARLIALDRRLAAEATTGEAEFEHYRTRLEDALSPGMWRYISYGESGSYPIDYRGTLRELYQSNFDRTLRTLLRGLEGRRRVLSELVAEATSLQDALQEAGSKGEAR